MAEGPKSQIDFVCQSENCEGVVKFDLAAVAQAGFKAVCPKCGREYNFDGELRDKLMRMMNLIAALRNAEDILGDSNVSVNVAGGSVKIPYALLVTRLNSFITLPLNGQKVDFHLWLEPTSPETFR